MEFLINLRKNRIILMIHKFSESDSEIDYDNPNPRTEGEKKYAYQRRAERDLKNRKAAIKIHGLRCSACSFDFEKIYGSRGKGYIEVHHKEQLSSLTRRSQLIRQRI